MVSAEAAAVAGLASVDGANAESFARLNDADPWVIDVCPAREVLPGYRDNLVLTSGAPMPWSEYVGGQREALIGGALFEGLAADRDEAIARFETGEIEVGACHDYSAVGSLAGIYTASMPVFVVENRTHGNLGFCNFYEGKEPRRLNYGCYDEGVHQRLLQVNNELAPVVGEAIRRRGGIALKPLIARALRMGDEVHSRNAAASILFNREILPAILDMVDDKVAGVREAMLHLAENDYFFLRLSMAAAKASADAMVVPGSTLVSAMAFSCRGFAIKLAGTGNTWFEGPPPIHQGKLFAGHTEDEITWMGGESPITETIGLGGFAQACALSLQEYQGGSPEVMIERNQEMYAITHGENSTYRIPQFSFRGTPTGIDARKVLDTGVLPVMDVGLAGRDGGQIGAGVIRAPRQCFADAMAEHHRRFGQN
ncbi:YahG/YlbE-like protein [Mycobacterium vulneris]|nr:YahG/YlbE-like protein [Mycolicibacterium vulneris]OCB62045.1 YahG/YlbE-like protein [Mycolicibacterium vulneris]